MKRERKARKAGVAIGGCDWTPPADADVVVWALVIGSVGVADIVGA